MTFVDEFGVEQVIKTTDVHPFWVVTDNPDLERAARDIVDDNGQIFYHENLESGLNGFWVEAKDLRIGDVFLGANGEISTLTNIVRVDQEGGIDVFNFKVEGNHNYYILAKEYEYGQTCVLVHNADCIKVIGRLDDTEKYLGLDDFDVLNVPKWNLDVNDAWVNAGIAQEQTFLLTSPIEGNLIQTVGDHLGEETVYARELRMLKEAGYVNIGDLYMVHPDKVSTFFH